MNSYGEMKLGNGKQGFNGKLESLPAINQAVHARHRIITKEVKEDEEEVEWDHLKNDLIAGINTCGRETNQQECVAAFCVMEEGNIITARSFTLKHSEGEIE